jgi:FMNH2-dependent dimethyl sulfone monooxygenase
VGRRAPKFGLNGAKADTPAVHGFRAAVQQAGRSTADGKGMWLGKRVLPLVRELEAQAAGSEPIAARA